VSNSMATIRWAAASILVGGVLYALYGVLNPLLGATLVGFLIGNLLGAALLTAGVTGLRVYLREQAIPLGRGGQAGLYTCVVALAIWTALGLASILSLVLVGPTRLVGRAGDISDGVLVVLFVGSTLLGAALLSRTNVLPRGAALLLMIASVLALLPALADYVLEDIPIWVFEVLRLLYGAAWAWVGYGLWATREAAAPRARVR
jgi:hypothetical protein